jgi:hypothetical protein
LARRRDLFYPLSKHAAPPHNVEDLGLIPINLDRARPQKVRCCMQVQKIRFHVFSSIEFHCRSCRHLFQLVVVSDAQDLSLARL